MKKTAADYLELVKQWHPTKNGDLKPINFSFGSSKKIWWKCPVSEDHEWQASVKNRIRTNGGGCPCCVGQKVVPSNCLATTHPELIKQWHPTKNGDLTPFDIVAGSSKQIWWKCPIIKDHEWKSTITTKINHGCSCCANITIVLSNCLANTHPEIAKQ
jgi:hypothetical protein